MAASIPVYTVRVPAAAGGREVRRGLPFGGHVLISEAVNTDSRPRESRSIWIARNWRARMAPSRRSFTLLRCPAAPPRGAAVTDRRDDRFSRRAPPFWRPCPGPTGTGLRRRGGNAPNDKLHRCTHLIISI